MELDQLSEACLQSGLLTKEQLLTACEKISPSSQSFVSYLIEQYAVDPLKIAQIASKRFDLPLFDLKTFDLKKAPISLVGREWIQEFQALPLYQGAQRLFVALCDPTHKHALQSLQTQTGLQPECVLVDHLSLSQAILKIALIPNKPTHLCRKLLKNYPLYPG
jgi:type IV pilus assembly protein PilB